VILALIAILADWKPPPCRGNNVRDINRCAQRDLDGAELAMNKEFARVERAIRTCRPRNSTKCYNMPRAILLVRKEQSTWRAYRDAKCNVFAFPMEDTSAEAQLRLDCESKMTVERTKELAKMGRD
jgi:uncharacterized protein YecT (DUF1311 family)